MDAKKIDRWYSRNAAEIASQGIMVSRGSKVTRQIVAHLVRDGRVKAFEDSYGDLMVVSSDRADAEHTAPSQLGKVNRFTRGLVLVRR
jgi:hypothetical protein